MTTYYFSLILVLATLFTGIVWFLDSRFLKPKRKQEIAEVEKQAGRALSIEEANKAVPEPGLVEFSRSMFPWILFLLILRSFIYEPFRIPSGSMIPTLFIGDFILVEKFKYGLRDPLFRKEFIKTGRPQAGDVIVFKYPLEPDLDYIKRVVGLPGDRVIYKNKTFYVERQCAPTCVGEQEFEIQQTFVDDNSFSLGPYTLKQYTEQQNETEYNILINPMVSNQVGAFYVQDGQRRAEWVVPDGHYFVIGDNRDNSRDSRFWGFVPEENLVGRAVFIWLSLDFDADENSVLPKWLPRVRLERLGAIE